MELFCNAFLGAESETALIVLSQGVKCRYPLAELPCSQRLEKKGI